MTRNTVWAAPLAVEILPKWGRAEPRAVDPDITAKNT